MNPFHVLMMKIPFQAQDTGGKGRTSSLASAGICPYTCSQTIARRRNVQPGGCRATGADPRSEACPEHGVRAQGEGLTMDYQHRLLSYHPPGQLVPRIKITLVL